MQRRPSLHRTLLLALCPLALLGALAQACSLTAPSDDELVTSCDDDAKNGGETDVDCGGPCGPCGTGRTCATGDDCVSGSCPGNVCEAASCADGVKNGTETDIDCGGPDLNCNLCGAGKHCNTLNDCEEDCVDGVCTGPSCDDDILNGDEGDVDCGGVCPTKCQSGEQCNEGSDCASGTCDENFFCQ